MLRRKRRLLAQRALNVCADSKSSRDIVLRKGVYVRRVASSHAGLARVKRVLVSVVTVVHVQYVYWVPLRELAAPALLHLLRRWVRLPRVLHRVLLQELDEAGTVEALTGRASLTDFLFRVDKALVSQVHLVVGGGVVLYFEVLLEEFSLGQLLIRAFVRADLAFFLLGGRP